MKSKSLLWCDLTPEHVDKLANANTIQEREEILASIFSLHDYKENYKSIILMELYIQTLNFSFKSDFSPAKTSTFFSILKLVHYHAISTPGINLDSLFGLFKSLLVNHSVPRPPYSVLVFSLQDVQLITDYVTNTYFRHVKLYLYIFTKKRVLHIQNVSVNIETPFSLPPLSEATMLPPAENQEPPSLSISVPGSTPFLPPSSATIFLTPGGSNPFLTPSAVPPTPSLLDGTETPDHFAHARPGFPQESENEDHHSGTAAPPMSIAAVISNELAREVQALASASVSAQFDRLKSDFEKKMKSHEQVLLEKLELLETKTKKGKPK